MRFAYMRRVSRSVTEALGGASLLNHVQVIPHNKHASEQRKLSLSPLLWLVQSIYSLSALGVFLYLLWALQKLWRKSQRISGFLREEGEVIFHARPIQERLIIDNKKQTCGHDVCVIRIFWTQSEGCSRHINIQLISRMEYVFVTLTDSSDVTSGL